MPSSQPTSVELLWAVADPAQLLKEAAAAPPFGPAFEPAMVQKADRLDVWGTTKEANEDYIEFRLLKDGRAIGVARIPGY